MNRFAGFTLIELMVTLAVAAILVTIAVPGMATLVQNSRTTSQTNELVSALNLARSEAVKRGRTVTVRAEGGEFADGWCVYQGTACNDVDPNERIRVYPAMNRMVVDTVPIDATQVAFNARGALDGASAVTMKIYPLDCGPVLVNRARELTVGVTGRVNVNRTDCP
jgi:type IV fimbrial biogenesis protein FimT